MYSEYIFRIPDLCFMNIVNKGWLIAKWICIRMVWNLRKMHVTWKLRTYSYGQHIDSFSVKNKIWLKRDRCSLMSRTYNLESIFYKQFNVDHFINFFMNFIRNFSCLITTSKSIMPFEFRKLLNWAKILKTIMITLRALKHN